MGREGLEKRRTGTRQVFVLFSVATLHYNIDISNDNSKTLLRATKGARNPYLAIFKTRNEEWRSGNGERGRGNGESLKRAIFKSRNL